MKAAVQKTLNFLRITDENNLLSLTNVALIVVIVKVAVAQVTGFADIGALLIALLSYQSKKIINSQSVNLMDEKADSLQTQLDATKVSLEEISSKVSAVALSNGFKPR